tara:strand:- start:68 stop:283 length:216 start_codon:yes stop_codon:yes gene_type:complete
MRITKDTQIRGHLNSMGFQINKEALKEFHKFFSAHMKLITDELGEMGVKRISVLDISEAFERLYGNSTRNN